jgi:hypothetical protein
MGYLNSEKPPAKYSAAYLKMFVERVRQALNYLDSNNFPNGLLGSIIKDKSLPLTKLTQGEWRFPIIAQASPYTTTSTTLVNVGQYIYWSPSSFPTTAKLYLEITGSSGGVYTATFELWGKDSGGADVLMTSINASSGVYEVLRSESFTPPTVSQAMLLKIKTGSASIPVGILGANLIIKLE